MKRKNNRRKKDNILKNKILKNVFLYYKNFVYKFWKKNNKRKKDNILKDKIYRKLTFYYEKIRSRFWKRTKSNKYVNILQNSSKEIKIIWFFVFLFMIIFGRLFYLQVVNAKEYQKKLFTQHASNTTLTAKRWNIFVTDNSWNERKLTENINIYTIFADPWFINDREWFVEKITPVLYEHFCEQFGLEVPDEITCIRNIEDFSWVKILPQEEKTFFLTWDSQEIFLDQQSFDLKTQEAIDDFSQDDAYELISEKLSDITKPWIRKANYFWYFDNNNFLNKLENLDKDYISIVWNYLYFIPTKVNNINSTSREILDLFNKHWYNYTQEVIVKSLQEREIRYVRIADNVSGQIIQKINDLKEKYFTETIDSVPLLHWLGYEKSQKRYYPYWSFMSHILWYINNEWKWFYWVEEYFDDILKWIDWQMVWVSVPWIWIVGSNNFEIKNPINGSDVYLTIDPTIQENVERIVKTYYNVLVPDTISVLVMDPHTGKIKASVNYPNYDPNSYSDYYNIEPLSYDQRDIVDDDQYIDIPVLLNDDWDLRMTTYSERKDLTLKKYVFTNKLWPQVFIDRNIAYPSEPGSTFKSVTTAIWLDSDEIELDDRYEDEWSVEIWPYTISNVQSQCEWYKTFLNALDWSCNVWMVRIVQKTTRYVFYSYLDKLWFGKLTWIELAGEESGRVTGLEDFSMARFFNNSFGQWLLITPIQLASAYSTMINWWYSVRPTILDKIYNRETDKYTYFEPKLGHKIFSQETSEKMLKAMWDILDMEDEQHLWSMVWIPFYSVWWKSWTSQIAFQWSYQSGAWWTIWGFAWVTTAKDPRYVIITQVRRPRQSERWGSTAWFINRDISKFLIEYSGIKE